MYRTRIFLWIALICIALGIKYIPAGLSSLFASSPNVNTVVDDTIPHLTTHMVDTGGWSLDVKLQNTVQDNTMVIMKKSSDETIQGYTKYAKAFTTPIVMFTNRDVKSANSGFITLNRDSTYNYTITKDIYDILQGLKTGASWSEVGVSKSVFEGKVKIAIPSESSPYYSAVVETIYIALNKGKDLTPEDILRLRAEVKTILSKCTKVEDVGQALYAHYKNEDKYSNTAILGPECVIADNDDIFESSSGWLPVYLPKTSEVTLDLFIKEVKDTDTATKETIKKVTKYFKGADLMSYTGLRPTARTFTISNKVSSTGYNHVQEVVSVGVISEEVKASINLTE